MEYLMFFMALAAPVFVFASYRQGIKDGQRLRSDAPVAKIFDIHKKAEMTEEQKKQSALLKLIEDYDGYPKKKVQQ